ncbi:DUF3800 domain-containing protein [Occultella kanbiaonis]|uniref:DUF3800 domain-containing protein n=1 Tax=Occultella kanbiaonis TaxID=2675754 RepID=UPI0012B9DF90|nr:DUF3800 domain-containing protein [Occultella kanbiaonis]
MTYIAYIDETGDTGNPQLRGASSCYALGCVIIDLDVWPSVFDSLVAFRRQVRTTFGIPLRAELKANYLIRDSGPLRGLGLAPSQRNYIYQTHMQLLSTLPAEAFAVVTDKAKTGWRGKSCFDGTWEMVLQRLERSCSKQGRTMLLAHDNGENDAVRALVRRARRYLTAGRMEGGGGIQFKADRILEDPVPRTSHHSYFIQLADLVAYAGWRSYQRPGAGVAAVVPQSMWSHIGSATKSEVNMWSLNGSVPGVVLRTR